MLWISALLFGAFLAYANGANDNFKGVATLLGSRTTSYRKALVWATVTTGVGSLAALALAHGLIETFSGKGLVPDRIAGDRSYAMAVGLAAALTVMIAARFGIPISTTHALTGGLVGAGLAASAGEVNLSALGAKFLAPLLVSPLLAMAGAAGLYPFFRFLRTRLGVEKETCLCIGEEVVEMIPASASARSITDRIEVHKSLTVRAEPPVECRERYRGRIFGIQARPTLDAAHFMSAGMVGFARGLNDTPKIAALLLIGSALPLRVAVVVVGSAMALGGWLGARRVAHTLSHEITSMNAGQGFTANLVTGLLVIFASRMGVPVSTTHVSCGALFGIGAATGQAHWKTISSIVMAWIVTLPAAGVLGWAIHGLMSGIVTP